jgi:hypothetical protein
MTELVALARAASKAADQVTLAGEAEAGLVYERLRSRAQTLNQVQGWADPEEFDTMFPTLDAQRSIEALDHHLGIDASMAREPGAPVEQLLGHLAAWAKGVAYGTILGQE